MTEPTDAPSAASTPDHEFVIIGLGVCGIYQLYKLTQIGADVLALDTHADLGGTWFKNRYPGCRFDSESYTYGYSFSDELLQEWNWSEHFASQPETLSYLNHVVDRFGLRKHMQFNTHVRSAHFDDATGIWHLDIDDGRTLTCRFLLTAVGLLSIPTVPKLPGMDSFRGVSMHTYEWPDQPLDLKGKRVAVIGTGASGVQLIASIADKVDTLTVFQRHPNWCAPLGNSPISDEDMAKIKASYPEILAKCDETPGGFIHGPDRRKFAEVPPEERRELWERLYRAPGFGIWLGNLRDVLTDEHANAEFSAFIAEKIRERVHDPVVAEQLIPKDHGFGVHRVPLETNYYETYNRDNVHLISLLDTPIVEITPTGVRTTDRDYEFDIIVYATGFDAITGAYDKMDIVGLRGARLRDAWEDGPVTYLGMQVVGFPNLVLLAGPHTASVATNTPRAIESAVNWTTRLFEYMSSHGYTRIEATPEAQARWTARVQELYGALLMRNAKSWFTGYNANVAGRDKTRYLLYVGGAPRYRTALAEVAENSYQGFVLS
jgi:cation diffusion facilitator CzcD-associated flavoprotein CzcO